jgi:hypothetical protein
MRDFRTCQEACRRRTLERQVVFAAQHMRPAAAARFGGGVTLFGSTLSNAACVGITAAFAAVFLALAVACFGKNE